ncbi:sortase [Candidatus Microgenomates bacterium]|jgi:sortase A|nr:MAG: sortase [Candidatus Microgenomates bacterium]
MEIILFDSSWEKEKIIPVDIPVPKPVEPKISSSFPFAKFARGLALGLIGISLFVFGAAVLPIIKLELSYRLNPKNEAEAREYFPKTPSYEVALENKKQLASQEAAKYGVDTDFSLVIPKISATSKIIANVDPADENKYKAALKNGVAHASGTKFPGSKGTIYLFAHSTNTLVNVSRYNAVFYLVKELEPGDQVIIFFAGLKYSYRVTEKVITTPEDLSLIKDNQSTEKLILQTCWPPGTTLKRLMVVAERI